MAKQRLDQAVCAREGCERFDAIGYVRIYECYRNCMLCNSYILDYIVIYIILMLRFPNSTLVSFSYSTIKNIPIITTWAWPIALIQRALGKEQNSRINTNTETSSPASVRPIYIIRILANVKAAIKSRQI